MKNCNWKSIELARQLRGNTSVERRDIFGLKDDAYCPIHLREDAQTMFAGYVGENYARGGIVVFGGNPGGGGDKYAARTAEDHVFYPLLSAFKYASDEDILDTFSQVNKAFEVIVQGWNLWNIFSPALRVLGKRIDEVAYLNVVPYRTRENRMPPVAAQESSWTLLVKPTLDMLQPEKVITLGKKAGGIVDRFYDGDAPHFCIPRTNGDRYISVEAAEVLAELSGQGLVA